jgi:hypothetical protein
VNCVEGSANGAFSVSAGGELAEQVEGRLGASVLIYLCLDDAALPAHDLTRLAIRSKGKTLKQAGEEILHAVAGVSLPRLQYTRAMRTPTF